MTYDSVTLNSSGKIFSLINYPESTECLNGKKMKPNPDLSSYLKIKSRWIVDVNIYDK